MDGSDNLFHYYDYYHFFPQPNGNTRVDEKEFVSTEAVNHLNISFADKINKSLIFLTKRYHYLKKLFLKSFVTIYNCI